MKKYISILLTFLISTALFSGCSCNKDDDLIIYRNFYEQDVTTFNYLLTNKYQDISRIANLVDGLVENDKYGNIVPSIANSWKNEIIDGRSVWTFYLKDNVYWSDYKGNKYELVTANDFVTSLKYILNYNTLSDNYSLPASLLVNGSNYYNATLIKNFNYDDVVSKIEKLKLNDSNNELGYYQNIKSKFDYCNLTNVCIDDFNLVGVKAVNSFELQFTLDKPVPYFLSALTYYSFLPANETFIKEVGFNNFGTTKKNLLYCGGYLLSDYFHSSRIEYTKNPNYWDYSNIYIDKLIFVKSPNYQTPSYVRLMYEAGNIDEFYLNPYDEEGMEKYVYGKNNTGSKTNPAGVNTYLFDERVDFTAYYMLFNQNRTSNKYSSLTSDEIKISNKAMQNLNFRKALSYGLNKESYLQNSLYTPLSSIVPQDFVYTNNKDFNDYFIETYASKNNTSIDLAKSSLSSNPFYSLDLSKYYLNLAINELNLQSNQLPIKIEYTYFYDSNYIIYDKERIRVWNYLLNGCDVDSSTCDYDKIEIVFNDSITSVNYYYMALENKEYTLTFLGLYPDFVDPTAYLNALGSFGELSDYLNHNEAELIDQYLDEIDKTTNLNERYKLCSELNYYIIFEKNLLLPLYTNSYTENITVTRLIPYQKMKSNYGMSPFKFKHRKISKEVLTQDDIKLLKEQYIKGNIEQ